MLRLTVGTKLVGVIVVAIVLVFIAGTGSIFELRRLSERTMHLVSSAQANQYAHAIERDLAQIRMALNEGLSRHDSIWFGQPLEAAEQALDINTAALTRLLHEQGQVARATEIASLHTMLHQEVDNILALAARNEWNIAYLSLANQVEPIENHFQAQVAAINVELTQDVSVTTAAIPEIQHNVLQNLAFITIGALLILSIASWLLWRNLILPLQHLTDTVTALAHGDLQVRAAFSCRTDEVGVLAKAFNSMADKLMASQRDLVEQVEARTAELRDERAALQHTLAELEVNMVDRERLLATLAQLQNPVIPVVDGVVVAPIVGQFTSQRVMQLQVTLLEMVSAVRARVVLLDITGVPMIDDQAAAGLLQVGKALQLLGASAILVGIRPEVAQSLVSLGMDAQHIVTTVDLQRGIDLALHMLRREIVPCGQRSHMVEQVGAH